MVNINDLDGVDAVIHLAGLSNDPLGEFNPKLTNIINYQSTIKLAKLAKKASVKRFIYASSQSMYGISDSKNELDEYNSENNLYYTEINGYDSCEEQYKYRTSPGPPVIIRNKETYLQN